MKTPQDPAVALIKQLSDAILAIPDRRMTKIGEHVKRNVVDISRAAIELATTGLTREYLGAEYALEAIHFTGDLYIAQVLCFDGGTYSFGGGGTPHEAIMFALADSVTPEPKDSPINVRLN